MNPRRLASGVIIFVSAVIGVRAAETAVPFSGAVDARAAALVASMTLEEKIGQMIQADYLALAGH